MAKACPANGHSDADCGRAPSLLVQMDAKDYTIRVIVHVGGPRRFDTVRSPVLVALLAVCALFGPLAGSSAANGPVPMPVVSRGVPAYGSELWFNCAKGCYLSPDNAVDASYSTKFATLGAATPTKPQWLAVDLNGKNLGPAYLVIYTGSAYDYDYTSTPGYGAITDFSIQGATGGSGTVPTTWTTLTSRAGQTLHSFSIAVDLTGYTWLRVHVTGDNYAAPPGSPGVDLQIDVHDARSGLDDSFKFFGDSITAGCMQPGMASNFSVLVNAQSPMHYPAFEDAGMGFWTTKYLLGRMDAWLANYPGRYVGISLGTNDANGDTWGGAAAGFYANLLALVDKTLAAGKTPVVPTIPWSSLPQYQLAIPFYNAKIQALYAARPEVVRGPDLWTYFQNNPIYLTSSDGLHPSAAGCSQMQKLWADDGCPHLQRDATAADRIRPVPDRFTDDRFPDGARLGMLRSDLKRGRHADVRDCGRRQRFRRNVGTPERPGHGPCRHRNGMTRTGPVVFTKSYDGQTFAAGQSRQYLERLRPSRQRDRRNVHRQTGVFGPRDGGNLSTGTTAPERSRWYSERPRDAPTPGPPRTTGADRTGGALATPRERKPSRERIQRSCPAPRGEPFRQRVRLHLQGWGVLGRADRRRVAAGDACVGENAVRVPLNEDCWLPIKSAPSRLFRSQHVSATDRRLCHAARPSRSFSYTCPRASLECPLESARRPASSRCLTQTTCSVLSQVATTFKSNGTVMLDLHNEPFPDSTRTPPLPGRAGGTAEPAPASASRLQGCRRLSTRSARRAPTTSSPGRRPVLQRARGVGFRVQADRTLATTSQARGTRTLFNACKTVSCYDRTVGVVAKTVPVLALEFGSSSCDPTSVATTMGWFDSHNLGFSPDLNNSGSCACSSPRRSAATRGHRPRGGQILSHSPHTKARPRRSRRRDW